MARVPPFWNDAMAPGIRSGQRVVGGAHGNSIRAWSRHLDGISDADIVGRTSPTASRWLRTGRRPRPIRHYYLGDAQAAARPPQRWRTQGKA